MEIDSALWTGRWTSKAGHYVSDRMYEGFRNATDEERAWMRPHIQMAFSCPACSGSGLGPVRKVIEDRGDRLYTVYEACNTCDGTGERT